MRQPKIRLKSRKLVWGVGINDVPEPTRIIEVVNGKEVYGIDPVYKHWHSMLARVYSKDAIARRPLYGNCSVREDWHIFSNFKRWVEIQDPADGYVLDKDILIKGNKVYSPESCVFVPKALNGFLTLNNAKRNGTLLGVSWHKRDQHWRSRVMNPFTLQEERLGSFSTELEAHLAWKRRKHEIACMWADKQKDPRLSKALRTRFLPLNEVYIED